MNDFSLVRSRGLEPPRLAALTPQASAKLSDPYNSAQILEFPSDGRQQDQPISANTVPTGQGGDAPDPVLLYLTEESERRAADFNLQVHTAYIYVIEAVGLGLFKIGLSNNLIGRFPAYRTECPVACRPLVVAIVPRNDVGLVEAALHARYVDRRSKGEWFALTPEDLDGLPAAIKEAAKSALRALTREINRTGNYRFGIPSEPLRNLDARVGQMQIANSIPTDELILDRLAHARECGEAVDATDLTRRIERRSQAIHEALRHLIIEGKVALVEPRRNPEGGHLALDAYRYCNLTLPDESCDWEETTSRHEILVSEPLGEFVPEFYGARPPWRSR